MTDDVVFDSMCKYWFNAGDTWYGEDSRQGNGDAPLNTFDENIYFGSDPDTTLF